MTCDSGAFDNAPHSALGLPAAEDGCCGHAAGGMVEATSAATHLYGQLCTTAFPWDCGHPVLVPGGTIVNTIQTCFMLLPDQEEQINVQWDK